VNELALPSGVDLTLIAVAICAVSTSGPLIAATAAPALAIAFWRNAFGAAALLPFAFGRRRDEWGCVQRRAQRKAPKLPKAATHFDAWTFSSA